MRLIDGDRLLEEKRMHTYYHLPNGDIAIPLIDIKNAPIIKPKQGEWISMCGNKQCDCSVCGERFDHTYEWIEQWNFCPNCGADMKKRSRQ